MYVTWARRHLSVALTQIATHWGSFMSKLHGVVSIARQINHPSLPFPFSLSFNFILVFLHAEASSGSSHAFFSNVLWFLVGGHPVFIHELSILVHLYLPLVGFIEIRFLNDFVWFMIRMSRTLTPRSSAYLSALSLQIEKKLQRVRVSSLFFFCLNIWICFLCFVLDGGNNWKWIRIIRSVLFVQDYWDRVPNWLMKGMVVYK